LNRIKSFPIFRGTKISTINNSETMIEDLIKRYKEFKRKEGHSDEFYKYEAIQHFQQNWNINAEDFSGMLRGL